MEINAGTINNWAAIFQAALALGLTVKGGIQTLVRQIKPDVTDEELNAIVQGVMADAARREALAAADVAEIDAKQQEG